MLPIAFTKWHLLKSGIVQLRLNWLLHALLFIVVVPYLLFAGLSRWTSVRKKAHQTLTNWASRNERFFRFGSRLLLVVIEHQNPKGPSVDLLLYTARVDAIADAILGKEYRECLRRADGIIGNEYPEQAEPVYYKAFSILLDGIRGFRSEPNRFKGIIAWEHESTLGGQGHPTVEEALLNTHIDDWDDYTECMRELEKKYQAGLLANDAWRAARERYIKLSRELHRLGCIEADLRSSQPGITTENSSQQRSSLAASEHGATSRS